MQISYKHLSWGLIGLLAILILTTFGDYGISTDEALRNSYGHAVIDFYLSGFTDNRAQLMGAASFYGGFFDSICALVNIVSPLDEFDTRHLLGAIIGLYGIIGAYQLAVFMADHAAGFFTVLFIIITPAYYGHLFINPKDLPFATFYIWTLYYGIQCLDELPKNSLKTIIKLGIHLGVLLAIKVVGGIVAVYLIIGLLFSCYQKKKKFDLKTLIQGSFKIIAIASVLAYMIMLIFWPWAWLEPFTNPFMAAHEFSRFSAWTGNVLVWGESFPYNDIPSYYLPSYFLVKLPEVFLFSLGVAIFWSVLRSFQRPSIKPGFISNYYSPYWTILILAAFMPIAMAIILHSTVYSGLRHFLFTIPVMAIFAGYGCSALIKRISNINKHSVSVLSYCLITAYLLHHITVMIALHPYQYTYFNSLTGGTAGAFKKFEMEYWSTSFKEAVAKLKNHINNQQNIKNTYQVLVFGPPLSASHYFSDSMKLAKSLQTADYLIINHRYLEISPIKDKPLLIVERQNTPYTYIFEQTKKSGTTVERTLVR